MTPAAQLDVALIAAPDAESISTLASEVAAPRTFAEVEVALDTATATGAERVRDLAEHGPWPDLGRLRHVGDADGLVSMLTDLANVVDGVRLHPLVLDEDLPVLSQLVLPALFRRGVAGRPVAGRTLRDNLGLARPLSRYQPTTTGASGATAGERV